MHSSVAGALDRAAEAAVNLLWRQWSALGVASARPARCVVDVEALLLASEWFALDEARLTSASETWRGTSDALISTQRLRNLAQRAALSPPSWLDTPAPRPDRTRRSAATPVTAHSASLQIQLRLLLGVGAKADCLALLLGRVTDESLPMHIIAEETRYGSILRRVTRDLAWARAISSSRDGRHGVVAPDAWWRVLQLRPPKHNAWQSWWKIFARIAIGRAVVADASARAVTEYGMISRIDDLWATLGEPLPWMTSLPTIPRAATGGAPAIEAWCEEIARLMGDDG